MNRFRRFMYGRNGPDQLGLAALIFGLVMTIISWFIPFAPAQALLQTLDYACLAYFIFRVISRNVYRRQEENTRFLTAIRPLREWASLRLRILREYRVYKYLKCPGCGQHLRAPRGKGKILVTCQKCGERFQRVV